MPKFKAILNSKNLLQKDFAARVGMSEEEASRMVRGKILPTVEKLKHICDILQTEPLEIYERKEINLLAVGRENRPPLEPHLYRLSVRIPREWCGFLFNDEKLKKCGYYSITHWIKVCLGRLKKQLEEIEKWEEKQNERAGKNIEANRVGHNRKTDLYADRKTAQGN